MPMSEKTKKRLQKNFEEEERDLRLEQVRFNPYDSSNQEIDKGAHRKNTQDSRVIIEKPKSILDSCNFNEPFESWAGVETSSSKANTQGGKECG